MGYYIQVPQNRGKAKQLCDLYGAIVVHVGNNASTRPSKLLADEALICVVDNGPYEGAAYCYSDQEFEVFNAPEDLRPKVWLLMDKALVHKLTNFVERRL